MVSENPRFSFHQVSKVFISLNSSIHHGEKDGEWHRQPLMLPISFVTLLFMGRKISQLCLKSSVKRERTPNILEFVSY